MPHKKGTQVAAEAKVQDADNKGAWWIHGAQEAPDNFNGPLDTFEDMAPSEMMLRACILSRNVAALVSDPGMTKTATVRSIAREMGYGLVTIIGAQKEAPDISGFPTRGTYKITLTSEDGSTETMEVPVTEYAPQKWQHFVVENKKVIIFLDEFSNTHPSTRAGMLSFIQDREFPDGTPFPNETVIVLAMNPTESAPDGYELDPATRNRITFIEWKPDNVKWRKGMLSKWGTVNPLSNNGIWRKAIVNFLEKNPGLIHKMPTENFNNENSSEVVYGLDASDPSSRMVANGPWPSHRTWDFLGDILGTSFKYGSPKNRYVRDLLVRGTVGPEAADKFIEWISRNGVLDVAKHLNDPDSFSLQHWADLKQDDWMYIVQSGIDKNYLTQANVANVVRLFEIAVATKCEAFVSFAVDDLSKILSTVNMEEGEKKDLLSNRIHNTLCDLYGGESRPTEYVSPKRKVRGEQ